MDSGVSYPSQMEAETQPAWDYDYDSEDDDEPQEDYLCENEYAEEQASSSDEGNKFVNKETGETELREEGGEEEPDKKKGIVEHLNDYLESIFACNEEYDEEVEEELTAMYLLLWRILSGTVGIICIIVIVTKYPHYLHMLHENQLWFSNIKEVEREISFRTEQGLYYSYYKQIIQAPSWSEGISELMRDNRTEHGRTINILHRFNIVPEVVLSAIYRTFKLGDAPILFYITSVFRLHGIYLASLFMTSWYLSSSCLGGFITSLLFFVHRVDMTRVNYTIPLRESFAVPLLFLQIFVICTFLRSNKWQKVKVLEIYMMTTSFLLSWQFGPFVILCQLFAFATLGRLHLMPGKKVTRLISVVGISLITSCGIQSIPPLVISSPALSMLVPALILSTTSPPSKRLGAVVRLIVAGAEMALLLIATMLINGSIKVFLNIDADSHIYQILLAKLHMGDKRDFDSRLYICNEAFMNMDIESLWRLSRSGLLPSYVVGIVVFGLSAVIHYFKMAPDVEKDQEGMISEEGKRKDYSTEFEKLHQESLEENCHDDVDVAQQAVSDNDAKPETSDADRHQFIDKLASVKTEIPDADSIELVCKDRPDLMLVIALSIIWSILAGLILRLKVLWLPTVCILAGVSLNDCRLYSYLFYKCDRILSYLPRWFPGLFKVSISLIFTGFVIRKYWTEISLEIWPKEVYEFWDPDTVELMEWIQQHTPNEAVFAGSMQLLAGVKLCTSRHITNHPHYEDSWLRHRTHEIYQIYGRESAAYVHEALHAAGATHIILEDSLCLAKSDPKQPLCSLVDLVDLHNGHIPVDGGHGIAGLKPAPHERFCDVVRQGQEDYNQYFSLVMSNKTFRVYRVAITK